MPEGDDEVRHIKPFADWLIGHNTGALHNELSVALNDVMSAVKLHGKSGTVTLTLKVEKMKESAGDVFFISDEVKTKAPQEKRAKAVYFADKDGNPVRENPNQMTFDSLREVPRPEPEEIRDVRRAAAGDTE